MESQKKKKKVMANNVKALCGGAGSWQLQGAPQTPQAPWLSAGLCGYWHSGQGRTVVTKKCSRFEED